MVNGSLTNATLVANEFNAEFNLTAADGEATLLVINDTNATSAAIWQWIQAGGGEMAALEPLKPIAAIITSFGAVPVGVGTTRADRAGRNASKWAFPRSALPAAVAVLLPLAPATARNARLPSIERPSPADRNA